ncbi:MAG: low molecular weight phosphotyrosine protein phosphatase [Clostridia bacterium]|nr:low molecular weight phosphotyrosine protein phosphatase [Clostridia bacterium]
MYRVCFVCLGNICRSPMCESIFTHLLKEENISTIEAFSMGTSAEELGNPVYRGTREVLRKHGIKVVDHYADVLMPSDYEDYDLFVCMDEGNVRACNRILGKDDKTVKLTYFTGSSRDVADPWYTGNFDVTFDDCYKGCKALLEFIKESI